MSLTILSNSLSAGYGPQLNSRAPKSPGFGDPPQVELLGNTNEDSVELTTLKIISEESDISANNQDLSNAEHKTRIRIDPETQEVIIEVVDGKTGEEVRQIPGEQQLRLNKSISEYNDILFKRVDNVDSNKVDDIVYKQPEPEK
tara:strand:+ start:194 stop:625 length:432 start_codon:yes stop_codon:yes gene_type:complete